jgi:hypothetical protein
MTKEILQKCVQAPAPAPAIAFELLEAVLMSEGR